MLQYGESIEGNGWRATVGRQRDAIILDVRLTYPGGNSTTIKLSTAQATALILALRSGIDDIAEERLA